EDDDDAEHPGDGVEPGRQGHAERTEDHAEEDEHGAEAEHEEEDAEEQPSLAGARPRGGGRPAAGPPLWCAERAGHAAEVADVAGDEGEDARGGEGHRARNERDRHAREERAAEAGRREGLGDAAPAHRTASASASSIMPRTTVGSICPSTRPATRPSASSTTVVGIAWSGTTPWSAATPRADSSWRLTYGTEKLRSKAWAVAASSRGLMPSIWTSSAA